MPRRQRPTDEESFRGDLTATPLQEKEPNGKLVEANDEEQQRKDAMRLEKPSHYRVESTGKVSRMPMLDPSEWGMDEAVEPYALKDGTEVRLLIVEAELRSSETGQYVLVRFEVEGEPYAKSITRIIGIPDRGKQTPKQFNDTAYYMRIFLQCFDIDASSAMEPSDDWPGHSGWCILSKIEDAQYGEQNKISKMIAPR